VRNTDIVAQHGYVDTTEPKIQDMNTLLIHNLIKQW